MPGDIVALATCEKYPSLSWLDPNPVAALNGLWFLIHSGGDGEADRDDLG
jgi:hypothetical protein